MTEVILILDGQSLKVKIKIDKYSFLLTSFLVFFILSPRERHCSDSTTFSKFENQREKLVGFFVILGQSNRERIPNSSSNVWQKKHLAPDQLAQMEEQWSVDSNASGDREFSAGHVPERPA